jgi:hypothetical protein
MPKIWLAPHALGADYKELCQCYARLLLSDRADAKAPDYCENVETRSQWLGLLPSLGAKQIGGQVGDASQSLGWVGHDQASGLDVIAFTVPLTPLVATGINHAQMPVIVRELLTWQGVLAPSGGAAAASWPRIDDLAEATWRPKAQPDQGGGAGASGAAPSRAEAIRMEQTNVPLGESLMAEVEGDTLPPRWTSQVEWADKQLPAKKDREDPLPWLKLAAAIAVLATALEALVALGARVGRLVSKRPEAGAKPAATLSLLALVGAGAVLAALGGAQRAEAKVEFNIVGYTDGPVSLSTLAREVSHRTSIELDTKPNAYPSVQPESLGDPWLFVRDPALLTAAGGALRSDVALWLKRGGFLVIESPLADQQLSALTEKLSLAAGGADGGGGDAGPAGVGAGWLPLPPDHELMRSFYLLDALPTCNGQIWRGFEYDGRLAILAVPYGFLASVKDHATSPACANPPDQERSVRIFVNLVMVALATDYKKDQIHLPEILKRLR